MTINTALFTGTATISTTEYSLTNNSTTIATQTTDAVIQIWIDVSNMVAGDEYEIALREKVNGSGSTQRRIVIANLVGAQADPFVSGDFIVGDGWDVTMDLIAGSARSISWSIRGIT